MDITWKYVKKLDDENSVRSFISMNKIELPEKLIRLLEENNGGRPSDKTLITKNNREYVFKSLLSYNKTDIETIYSVYPELFLDVSLYPLGTDAAGNFVCYNTNNKIYVLLNHENNTEEELSEIPFLP